jgi:transcriptional regulator with XRE-family HTH domain
MAQKFAELRAKMSPESQMRAAEATKKLLQELPLHELRAAREMTQVELAGKLEITQGAVSQIERSTDMYISTLQKVIRGMGGKLEIRAVFPDGDVQINQFEELEEQPLAAAVR